MFVFNFGFKKLTEITVHSGQIKPRKPQGDVVPYQCTVLYALKLYPAGKGPTVTLPFVCQDQIYKCCGLGSGISKEKEIQYSVGVMCFSKRLVPPLPNGHAMWSTVNLRPQ